jgi:hypothetical protein
MAIEAREQTLAKRHIVNETGADAMGCLGPITLEWQILNYNTRTQPSPRIEKSCLDELKVICDTS